MGVWFRAVSLRGPVMCNVLCWVYVGLSYVSLVVSFFQKSNCFCYGFVFRLFCVLLFLS